ncbi:MAG: FkbM family methyltransferase [Devosia sp.]|uniref:FkbM family methyltransferase n=1 Tax=Devosia sp. TaxID=1871048 RepID=UPI0024C7239C|nr:FkbM family methyltransferase [Devosia sp.]UYO00446.1 MAG: FkbM family methyltransferase [Devosia sp.]
MMFLKADTVIGRSLDLYGEWCESEMAVLGQVLRPGDWVLDAGANVGTHTVFFAKAVGNRGRVVAVEPQRLVRNILCANLALNDLQNVRVVDAALGAEQGKVSIAGFGLDEKRNHGRFSLEGAEPGKEKVAVRTVDRLGLKHCHLIKIDVEGFEREVLQGAADLIAQKQPAIWFENNVEEHDLALTSWFVERGYSLHWHFDGRFNPNNFRAVRRNIFETVKMPSINMLALPVDGREPPRGVMAMEPGDTIEIARQRWSSRML